MRRSLAILTLPLLLVGCSTPAPVATEDVASPSSTETASDCITPSADAIAGLQWGLDQKQPDMTIEEAAAVPVDDHWIVAATFTGPGIPDPSPATWYTQKDPQASGEYAYLSVDAVATEFSAYAQPDGASINTEGVDAALDCLN